MAANEFNQEPEISEGRTPKASIVIVDAAVALTGGLRCASRLARLIAPWADTTLVLSPDCKLNDSDLAEFTDVVRMPVVQLRKSPASAASYLPSLLLGGWRLRKLLAQKNADVLILNDFFMMQGAAARALGFGGKILTWVRLDPLRFPKALSRSWLAAAYRSSNAIIAVSDFIVSRLPPSSKVRRIYDTMDLDLPAPPGQPRQGHAREIVCVANFIQGKGQDHAIDAFARVATDFPDARLIFYGGDMGLQKNRDYLQTLRTRASATEAGTRIIFSGFTTDIPAVMATATAALVLSESESFSLTCLEASQLGVPVIAFRSGGPAEIVVDGVTGFLCNVGDVEAAATGLRRLLGDPDEALRMGRAGAAHVQQKFGRDAFVAAMREVLEL